MSSCCDSGNSPTTRKISSWKRKQQTLAATRPVLRHSHEKRENSTRRRHHQCGYFRGEILFGFEAYFLTLYLVVESPSTTNEVCVPLTVLVRDRGNTGATHGRVVQYSEARFPTSLEARVTNGHSTTSDRRIQCTDELLSG